MFVCTLQINHLLTYFSMASLYFWENIWLSSAEMVFKLATLALGVQYMLRMTFYQTSKYTMCSLHIINRQQSTHKREWGTSFVFGRISAGCRCVEWWPPRTSKISNYPSGECSHQQKLKISCILLLKAHTAHNPCPTEQLPRWKDSAGCTSSRLTHFISLI